MGAGGGEVGQRLAQGGRIVGGEGRGAGDDAEEPRVGEVVAGHLGQQPSDSGLGTPDDGEDRHRDVELGAAALLDVEPDLRAALGRRPGRRPEKRERECQGRQAQAHTAATDQYDLPPIGDGAEPEVDLQDRALVLLGERRERRRVGDRA